MSSNNSNFSVAPKGKPDNDSPVASYKRLGYLKATQSP